MSAVTVPMGDVALASNILLAILENLRRLNNKRQLFLKVYCDDLQKIFYEILVDGRGPYLSGGKHFLYQYLLNLFVFSNCSPNPSCPVLQEAVQQLQLAGMICWPDTQEPNLMRLEQSATYYYEYRLLRNTTDRLAYQDVISAQEIAKTIYAHWQQLLVGRPHLINLPD